RRSLDGHRRPPCPVPVRPDVGPATPTPRIEHVTDQSSRLQMLHFARRVVVQQATAALTQIDQWIADEERREAERQRGEQARPAPPDWLIQYGVRRAAAHACSSASSSDVSASVKAASARYWRLDTRVPLPSGRCFPSTVITVSSAGSPPPTVWKSDSTTPGRSTRTVIDSCVRSSTEAWRARPRPAASMPTMPDRVGNRAVSRRAYLLCVPQDCRGPARRNRSPREGRSVTAGPLRGRRRQWW